MSHGQINPYAPRVSAIVDMHLSHDLFPMIGATVDPEFEDQYFEVEFDPELKHMLEEAGID